MAARPRCGSTLSVLICLIISAASIVLLTYTTFSNDVSSVTKLTEFHYNKHISTLEPDSTVHSKTEDIGDILTRFDARRKRVEIICDKQRLISGKTDHLISNRPHNISACMVPKAGMTIWLRLFKFLVGQKSNTGNPMSISKYEVHFKDMQFFKQIRYADPQFIAKSLKVMTVRNPYTRLMSAYIDKFVLPGFWQRKGKEVIQMTRPNASATSLTCGNDVTFAEFVQFVVNTGHSFRRFHNHWIPESDICDPCLFRPGLIIKQETFMPDFSFVMNEIKLLPILSSMTLVSPEDYEIQDEIKFNFEIAKLHSNCTDIVGICERIWQAFVLNGYLPPTETFPSEIINNKVTWNKMYQIIKDVRTRNNITKQDTNRLRKQTLRDAYARIPEEHLHALQKLFQKDFQLFGYDKNLTTLFY